MRLSNNVLKAKNTFTRREQPRIRDEHLQACLQNQYALVPVSFEFLPRGHDYNAGLYRVVSEPGTSYLLKVTSRPLYQPSYLVPSYLHRQGITSIVTPILTQSQTLWTKVGDWTVIVYPFIEGDTSLTGMTPEQWKTVGTILHRIHTVRLPPAGFESLRKERFDPTTYTRWIRTFETQHLNSQEAGNISERTLHASWIAHQSTIEMIVNSLEKLSVVLHARTFPYVICHADLHPANLLRDHAGNVFVIDWDAVMLAPRERDFIFVREPQADTFWEGYGQREVDWTVLTYYLCERVVQDLIEYATHVCFREDWSETKADLAKSFDENLTKGKIINAAYAATAHLDPDLIVHS